MTGLSLCETRGGSIFRQSEQLEREAVAAIVDGTYAAEGALDDDGADHGPVLIVLGDLESADSEAKELLGVGGHR